MSEKCAYRGNKIGSMPGTKLHCPLCDEVLITIERNGRSWVPAHDRKVHMKVYHYKHCTKGDNAVRGQHDAP